MCILSCFLYYISLNKKSVIYQLPINQFRYRMSTPQMNFFFDYNIKILTSVEQSQMSENNCKTAHKLASTMQLLDIHIDLLQPLNSDVLLELG